MFKVKGLEWFNYEALYSDTAVHKLVLSDMGDSVDYQLYSIYIRPIQETYFTENTKSWNFDFIQSAYACEPVTPQTDETIDSISITSTKDYNLSHPAGTNLSDLFDIVVLDEANFIHYERFQLQDYVQWKPEVPNILILFLREPPLNTTEFTFEVKYYQDGIDNDFFKLVTNTVVIKGK